MKYSEYIEKKRRGEPGFPISYYNVTPAYHQYVMEAHWHNELEIIRVNEGRFLAHVDNEERIMNKGDILFVDGGCIHRGVPENCSYECIVLDLNILRKQTQDAMEKYVSPIVSAQKEINCFLTNNSSSLYASVDKLCTALKNREQYFELTVLSTLYEIIFNLYKEGRVQDKTSSKHSAQREIMSILLDYIDTHYNEPISLSTLSNLVNMNEKYLCRLFSLYTSKTPIAYINELRIEKACYNMQVKNATVTESAINCGFNDVSYFTKVFKSIKNVTPTQYKKNVKN
ncbi:MAG: AraC family transcriptional regulator [Clostridia bacterium]|nr:AraC family transcriptional regulator [Clostridia bacterium]